MEQNFQTSFIPKKMIVKERVEMPRSVGFSTIVSIFILFATVIGTGGLFFYKTVLQKNISSMEQDLKEASNRFEPAKIAVLQDLDNRLTAANDILSKHVVVSPIFQALQDITLKTVRFTKFSYTLPTDGSGKVSVSMAGVAIGYRSVALQADLFAKNKNLIDPVFSNLQLDDKGNVNFDLNFSVDARFVNYKQLVLTGDINN